MLVAALLLCFAVSVSRLDQGHRGVYKQQLETALRRASAACYAAEGFYPPDVAYLVEHYGLRYDADAYWVHYELFASNLMPDITVVEKDR